jgi:hypothetical protein
MGSGDLLNRRLVITIGNNVDLVAPDRTVTQVASAGLVFTILSAYVDDLEGGIAAIAISTATMEIE